MADALSKCGHLARHGPPKELPQPWPIVLNSMESELALNNLHLMQMEATEVCGASYLLKR